MKAKFKQVNDAGDVHEFTVEAETPLQCLAKIEVELRKVYEGCDMAADDATDFNELIDILKGGDKYERIDFGTPEENFTITVED